MQLEDIQPNAAIRGILPNELVTVVQVQRYGSEALELTYKTAADKVDHHSRVCLQQSGLRVLSQHGCGHTCPGRIWLPREA